MSHAVLTDRYVTRKLRMGHSELSREELDFLFSCVALDGGGLEEDRDGSELILDAVR